MEAYNLDFETHLKIRKILDPIIYNLNNRIPLNNCKESINQVFQIFKDSKSIDTELSLHLNKLLKLKRIHSGHMKELRNLLDDNYESPIINEEDKEYGDIYYK